MLSEGGLKIFGGWQENVYTDRPFYSVKKVVRDLGTDYDGFEVVSFHSTSKVRPHSLPPHFGLQRCHLWLRPPLSRAVLTRAAGGDVPQGIIGECGRRGGYMELQNFDPAVQEQIYKMVSIGLCSNISGQVAASAVLDSVVLLDVVEGLRARRSWG